jgi:hypothetical protein
MDQEKTIIKIAADLGLEIPAPNEGRTWLEQQVNHLLVNDMSRLLMILYRVDVSEEKLKTMLKNNAGTDAAIIITDLLIERQLQKEKTRNEHRESGEIDENEKW